jgi:glyoxylase-like metal-dependent hydrolase (beta-lactamase superfamily II)
MIRLKYGNTNTFYVPGKSGGLLIDTDYAGTLQAFFRSLKMNHLELDDISYVLPTHCHPDHIGLIGELQRLGVKLLLIDKQLATVHFPDGIFRRDRHLRYVPIDEKQAAIISCGVSREFLRSIGIEGEIISTSSHSKDSISVILDCGDCFVGDLEPFEYLGGYENNLQLQKDWSLIMSRKPKRIFYAHANEKILD